VSEEQIVSCGSSKHDRYSVWDKVVAVLPQALKTSKEVLKSPSHIMPVLLLQFSLNWLTNPDQNEIKKSGMTSGIEILQT